MRRPERGFRVQIERRQHARGPPPTDDASSGRSRRRRRRRLNQYASRPNTTASTFGRLASKRPARRNESNRRRTPPPPPPPSKCCFLSVSLLARHNPTQRRPDPADDSSVWLARAHAVKPTQARWLLCDRYQPATLLRRSLCPLRLCVCIKYATSAPAASWLSHLGQSPAPSAKLGAKEESFSSWARLERVVRPADRTSERASDRVRDADSNWSFVINSKFWLKRESRRRGPALARRSIGELASHLSWSSWSWSRSWSSQHKETQTHFLCECCKLSP
jgi:hypothetical protein